MRKMTHRIGVAVATLGLAVTGIVGLQPAQEAQAAIGSCPSGAGCLWVDRDFGGRMAQWQNCINDFGDYGFNNVGSSVYNHGNYDTLYFYKGVEATGGNPLARAVGRSYSYVGGAWNDQISSAFFSSALKYAGNSRCN